MLPLLSFNLLDQSANLRTGPLTMAKRRKKERASRKKTAVERTAVPKTGLTRTVATHTVAAYLEPAAKRNLRVAAAPDDYGLTALGRTGNLDDLPRPRHQAVISAMRSLEQQTGQTRCGLSLIATTATLTETQAGMTLEVLTRFGWVT
jgi:hypothetical protein